MEKYESIINMPYQKSTKRKHMSLNDRAAQFAPFAALTGYEESIKEVSRSSLRNKYGMVLQDTWLFNSTIRENIAYGNPNAPLDDIIEGLNKAVNHKLSFYEEVLNRLKNSFVLKGKYAYRYILSSDELD